MTKSPDFYLDHNDIRAIIYTLAGAFARILEPESKAEVGNWMRAASELPSISPDAARAIVDLAYWIEDREPPQPRPKPDLKVVKDG